MTTPPVVLSLSASDSGGGAGVQADLRTYLSLGVHGATAITALTAQSTSEFRGLLPTPAQFLRSQIETVLDDLTVRAAKTGMLGSPDNAETVAELADAGHLPNLVVDPVLVSSTGATIVDDQTRTVYTERLFPAATVITPNSIEAALVLGSTIESVDDLADSARSLGELGPSVVVVKGGRLDRLAAVDAVWDGTSVHLLESDRIDTENDHGSGCSFAAATAAGLAQGRDPLDAIRQAKSFVDTAIAGSRAWRLGSGHGPLDHRRWITEPSRP